MSLHELTPEQQEIRALARRFADERIAPHAAEWDRGHTFPREVFAALGELGLMGVCVPEEHGGAGAGFLSYELVLEELSRADAGVGVTVVREEEKMGLNSSSTADIAFEDTPAERLGDPGAGMRIALRTLDAGRIGIAAQAVGIAQAALDLASGYAKERNAFGGPIARLGTIQQKLAYMQT